MQKIIAFKYFCHDFDTVVSLNTGSQIKRNEVMRITKINSDCKSKRWNFARLTNNEPEELKRELNGDDPNLSLPRLDLPLTPPQAVYFMLDLETAIAKIGSYPVIIKPLDAVSEIETIFKVDNWKEAKSACKLALPESKSGGVLVEKFNLDRNYKTKLFCI